MTTPWIDKETLEAAFNMAARNGFSLKRNFDRDYSIELQTAGSNEHGFANDIMLERFNSWHDVVVFFVGWEKRELAYKLAGAKK